MTRVVMLNVPNNPFMLSVVMLNDVILLSVVAPSMCRITQGGQGHLGC
jgi:hypothetical protein